MNTRQLATTLAALRYWQRMDPEVGSLPEIDIATDGGTVTPLTPDEIDELCEQLQRRCHGNPDFGGGG